MNAQQTEHVSGAENGAERPKIGWSGAERGAGVAENDEAGAERGAGGRGEGSGGYRNRLERAERLFCRSRSAHML